MKVITSRENAIYKSALKLLRKKYRDESGQYLLEGQKPLRDAIGSGIRIEKVFVLYGTETDAPAGLPEDRVIALERSLFLKLTDTEHSQGVIAVASREHLDEETFAGRTAGGHIVILDRLQDPGNAGTIIRTAEAAGFRGIIAVRGTVDLFSPKVVRAAAGSVLRMPILTDVLPEDVLRMTEHMERPLAVTLPEGARNCFEVRPERPAALVIGNEGNGIGPYFTEAAELKLTIPMEGSIESLNAAVAAGIVMYCMRRS